MGLEDVTAFFADGLKASAEENSLNRAGVQTALDIKGDFTVRYIQGVAKVPKGFADVADVQFAEGSVVFVSTSGDRAAIPITHEYLKTGNLPSASGK